MKRNWKDIVERALTMAAAGFLIGWESAGYKLDWPALKGALIGAAISVLKNLAFQGTVTQTPREELPVAVRVEGT